MSGLTETGVMLLAYAMPNCIILPKRFHLTI